MRLIRPSFEIIQQGNSMEDMLKHIELCGRVCYKSEDKITDDSYIKFIQMLVNKEHFSPLGHGTIYLKVPMKIVDLSLAESPWEFLNGNHWTHIACDSEFYYYTTNYRVIVENTLQEVLEYMCEPTEHHEKRVTVKMECPISMSRELNRHTANSISEQSTRYCNFSKGKFDNNITICVPHWITKEFEESKHWLSAYDVPLKLSKEEQREFCFFMAVEESETRYFSLLDLGLPPQDARGVLPLETATEVAYTAFVSDWKHLFRLRTAPDAHPEVINLISKLESLFKEKELIR
jgi:thymidylate synthase (FAD)